MQNITHEGLNCQFEIIPDETKREISPTETELFVDRMYKRLTELQMRSGQADAYPVKT